MMNLLIVTFSLRNQLKNYEPFYVAIRGNSLNWWHFIEQTMVVSTPLDIAAFCDQLYPHIETTDSLLVAKITPHMFQGWLPLSAWEWLNRVSAEERAATVEHPALPFPPGS
jgi:hypothetical protein